MESSNTEKLQTRKSFSRSFHANESEVLHGRLSLGGQHLHFTKRIRELESELDTLKYSQVLFTQHKVIAERDLTVARLSHKISEQDLFIKTLSRELNNFGEGSSLLEKINQLLHKLEQSEEDQRSLRKKLGYFEALAAEGLLPTADILKEDQIRKKKQAELESELRAKDEDLKIMEKRLNELKEIRNDLVEYTVTLEEKIKKFEDDKNDYSEGVKERDQIIERLENQLFSLEQNSKDEQDFFFQQLNRKTSAMQNEIKELENKLKLQASAKDERVEALNVQLQDLMNKFEQLKKEYAAAKEKNDELANITHNFDAKVLEVTDALTAKFRRTEEELREKIHNLAREKTALEQMLSEACMDSRPSIAGGISFEDEMRNLEEFRPSWVHVNTNVDELNSRIGQLKLEIIEKDRVIEETQAEAEEYKRALLDRDRLIQLHNKERENSKVEVEALNDKIQENDELYNSLAEETIEKDQTLTDLKQKLSASIIEDEEETLHQRNRLETELVFYIQKNKDEIIQQLNLKNQEITKQLESLRTLYNQDTERLSLKLDEVSYQNKQLESKIETLLESEEDRKSLHSEKQEEEMTKLSLYRSSITNVKQVLNEEFSTRYEELKEECVIYTQVKKDSIISQLRLENEGLAKDLAKHKEMYNEAQEDMVAKYKESDELVQALQNLRAKMKILEMENQRYKLNKVDSKILKLQLENETLRGEYEKMKTDLLLSKEKWAQELNNLYEEIQQNEQRARTSRLETSKIAEERDIFKTFIEKKLSKKKHSSSKSWFDFFKS